MRSLDLSYSKSRDPAIMHLLVLGATGKAGQFGYKYALEEGSPASFFRDLRHA